MLPEDFLPFWVEFLPLEWVWLPALPLLSFLVYLNVLIINLFFG